MLKHPEDFRSMGDQGFPRGPGFSGAPKVVGSEKYKEIRLRWPYSPKVALFPRLPDPTMLIF